MSYQDRRKTVNMRSGLGGHFSGTGISGFNESVYGEDITEYNRHKPVHKKQSKNYEDDVYGSSQKTKVDFPTKSKDYKKMSGPVTVRKMSKKELEAYLNKQKK